jgi:hypothetical protein
MIVYVVNEGYDGRTIGMFSSKKRAESICNAVDESFYIEEHELDIVRPIMVSQVVIDAKGEIIGSRNVRCALEYGLIDGQHIRTAADLFHGQVEGQSIEGPDDALNTARNLQEFLRKSGAYHE